MTATPQFAYTRIRRTAAPAEPAPPRKDRFGAARMWAHLLIRFVVIAGGLFLLVATISYLHA